MQRVNSDLDVLLNADLDVQHVAEWATKGVTIMQRDGTSPTGMAVAGVHYWCPNLVRTATATQGLQLEWLCDLDEDSASIVIGPFRTVWVPSSYDPVLADPAVAAVATATSVAKHFEFMRGAIKAVKYALVEKPLTLALSEAEKLVALGAGIHV